MRDYAAVSFHHPWIKTLEVSFGVRDVVFTLQVVAIVTDRLTDCAVIGDLHGAASRGVAIYIILNQRSIQENFTLKKLRHPVSRLRQTSLANSKSRACVYLETKREQEAKSHSKSVNWIGLSGPRHTYHALSTAFHLFRSIIKCICSSSGMCVAYIQQHSL